MFFRANTENLKQVQLGQQTASVSSHKVHFEKETHTQTTGALLRRLTIQDSEIPGLATCGLTSKQVW